MTVIRAKTVKCVVWDLDDTLWDGVLLEGDDPRLRPAALDTIRTLDARGILHAAASRGDADLTHAHLRSVGLLDYLVHVEVGWGAKSDAVARTAERLNLGLDTFAFVDNDPSERDEVASRYVDVRTYPAEALAGLPDLPEFRPEYVTDEAAQRRAMYQAEQRRQADEQNAGEHRADFLAGLGLEMTISRATEEDFARVRELIVRTHQLNTTGRTYSLAELRELGQSERHEVLVARLVDRYGSYGTVGLSVTESAAGDEVLRLLLMSCRVVSRGVGSVLLDEVVRRARQAGARPCAEFVPTPVNRIMLVALRFGGFVPVAESADGTMLLAHRDGLVGPAPASAHVRVISRPRLATLATGDPA